MILTLDVGNTNMTGGVFEGDEIKGVVYNINGEIH